MTDTTELTLVRKDLSIGFPIGSESLSGGQDDRHGTCKPGTDHIMGGDAYAGTARRKYAEDE